MGLIGPIGLMGHENISPIRLPSSAFRIVPTPRYARTAAALLAPGFWLLAPLLITDYYLLPTPRPSDLFRHVNKLDNGLGLHFAHDVGAMDFYGNLAAPQLGCDLFVKQA